MKIGRNDPCPCGSGKKYKHCCLNRPATATSSAELTRRRVRRGLEGLPRRMLHFIDHTYGPAAMVEAWEEFMLWNEAINDFDPETPHLPVFIPWFLHHWSPNPDESEVADTHLYGLVPTQAYLDRKKHQLTPIVRAYLQSCLDHPFSFYEVEAVEPGHCVALRDLLTGEHHDARERSATQSLSAHDVVYAQLARVNDATLIEGLSQMVFPPSDKIAVIELRKQMRKDADDDVFDAAHIDPDMWDVELRELYLTLSERVLSSVPPSFVTSDGEPLEFHQLIYDIDSAQTAYEALQSLDALTNALDTMTSPGLTRTFDGTSPSLHIDWSEAKQGDAAASGVQLGAIDIEGQTLTAETRSRERAERLKALIDTRLAGHATFRADKIQTVEQILADAPARLPPSPPSPQVPEVQDLVADHLHEHYLTWIDTPLPALDGHTPRHAAQTSDGREQVEALLQEAEGIDVGLPAATRKTIFDAVRQQLDRIG